MNPRRRLMNPRRFAEKPRIPCDWILHSMGPHRAHASPTLSLERFCQTCARTRPSEIGPGYAGSRKITPDTFKDEPRAPVHTQSNVESSDSVPRHSLISMFDMGSSKTKVLGRPCESAPKRWVQCRGWSRDSEPQCEHV